MEQEEEGPGGQGGKSLESGDGEEGIQQPEQTGELGSQ